MSKLKCRRFTVGGNYNSTHNNKEIHKFWGNKRTVFTTIILPGLAIWILYTALGGILKSRTNDSTLCNIYTVNINSENEIYQRISSFFLLTPVNGNSINEYKEKIASGENSLLLIFPTCFSEIEKGITDIPGEVQLYYNSSSNISVLSYESVISILNDFESSLCNAYNINSGSDKYDLSTEGKVVSLLSNLLPMLLLGLVFSSGMTIAAESIAGEKENGTLNTLLVTPVLRRNIAFAKIIAMTIISTTSAISSFIGTIVSLPSLLNISFSEVLNTYGIRDFTKLLFTLLSSVFVMVSLMLIISAISKNVKEAITAITPFTAGAMIIGMICISFEHVENSVPMYLIPFYNTAQILFGIFKQENTSVYFVVMIIANLFFAFLGSVILTKVFKSERLIMV